MTRGVNFVGRSIFRNAGYVSLRSPPKPAVVHIRNTVVQPARGESHSGGEKLETNHISARATGVTHMSTHCMRKKL